MKRRAHRQRHRALGAARLAGLACAGDSGLVAGNDHLPRPIEIHRFDNLAPQDAKALCVITPAAIGPEYFREMAEVMRAAAGGPPDRAKIAEIMRRHGLTPAP